MDSGNGSKWPNRFCPPSPKFFFFQQKRSLQISWFVSDIYIYYIYIQLSSNRTPLSILRRANLLLITLHPFLLHFEFRTFRIPGSHRPSLCLSWPNLAPWSSSSPASSCASQRKWCGCEKGYITKYQDIYIATEKKGRLPPKGDFFASTAIWCSGAFAVSFMECRMVWERCSFNGLSVFIQLDYFLVA